MKSEILLWVGRVRHELTQLLEVADAPVLDVGWLIKRCDDTFLYPPDLQKASVAQLVKDLAEFEVEFPGRLSSELLLGPRTR